MRRKVSGGAGDYIIPLGIVGIIGVVAWKMGLFSGTGTGTGQQSAAQAANDKAANDAAYAASAAQVPQSLTDTQINTIIGNLMSDAEQNTSTGSAIMNLVSTSSASDDVLTQMGTLGNITDLYRLIQLWGTRDVAGASGSICDLIDIDCTAVDFGTFIHAILSSSQLSQLNTMLSNNGINYTFS